MEIKKKEKQRTGYLFFWPLEGKSASREKSKGVRRGLKNGKCVRKLAWVKLACMIEYLHALLVVAQGFHIAV
jgi:hypothetical protein